MTRPSQSIENNDERTQAWRNEDATAAPGDLFSRISRIEQAHTHPRDRGDALLAALCKGLGAVAGTITYALAGEEYELETEGGPAGAKAWMPALRSAALEARSHSQTIARVFGSKTEAPEFVVIAAPLDLSGRDPFGGVAILCRCRDAAQAERLQLHLRSASILASSALSRSATKRHSVEVDDFARVLSKAGHYKSVDQFAFAMTNAAKQRFNCEQAALGLLKRHTLKVACISGLDDVKKRSPGVHHIEQAMGECLDALQPIVEQAKDRWEGGDSCAEGMLHKRWRAACAGASVASIPVYSGEEPVGVLSLRRSPDEPFDEDEIAAVQKLLAPLGSAIPLISRSTRSLPTHAMSSTKQSVAWFVRPKSITKKLIVIGAVAGAAWYAMMPAMYKVTTPGTVVAEREHVIASTIDSRVSEVLVRAGDRVETGDPLVRLDTAALLVERESLRSEIERADIRIKEAIAQNDPATASVARAERDVHTANLTSVQSRIDSATILAPNAGIVTGTELANLTGRIVPKGEPLFSIADEASLALELRIPQSRVTDLTAGAPLKFASHARPENPGRSEVLRIAPSGVERQGKTVFLATSPLPEGQAWLRPGMEGVAIVEAGIHPNWWIGLHRFLDTARLNFWID